MVSVFTGYQSRGRGHEHTRSCGRGVSEHLPRTSDVQVQKGRVEKRRYKWFVSGRMGFLGWRVLFSLNRTPQNGTKNQKSRPGNASGKALRLDWPTTGCTRRNTWIPRRLDVFRSAGSGTRRLHGVAGLGTLKRLRTGKADQGSERQPHGAAHGAKDEVVPSCQGRSSQCLSQNYADQTMEPGFSLVFE